MDKDVNTGALHTKQWHCAVNSVSLTLKSFSREIPTRGLPTKPSGAVMYYRLPTLVAFVKKPEFQRLSNLQKSLKNVSDVGVKPKNEQR